jgi:hypothetical protein
MEHGDDGGRGKRKMLSKQQARRGRGRASSSSGAAPRASFDRAAREQYIEDEERLKGEGHTIFPAGHQGTPLHITEFDDSYMRGCNDEFTLKAPDDRVAHPLVDYSKS